MAFPGAAAAELSLHHRLLECKSLEWFALSGQLPMLLATEAQHHLETEGGGDDDLGFSFHQFEN